MLCDLGISSTQSKRRQNMSVDPFMLTSFFEKMIAPELYQKDDSQISKILKGVIEKYNQQLAGIVLRNIFTPFCTTAQNCK